MFWLNGRLLDEPVAPFDLRDRGLLLADGLFETILVVGGVPFRLDDHLARLQDAARQIKLSLDETALRAAASALAAHADDGLGALRLTVTRGPGQRGLRLPADPKPNVFGSIAPWRPAAAFAALRLALASIRRNEGSPLSRMKTAAYLDNVLALEEAVGRGADDALLVNGAGRVACTAMANVFAIAGDDLLTPPVTDGVLPGITRKLVLGLAPAVGLSPREVSLGTEDLIAADMVFTTNSLRLVSPVTALDGKPLGQSGSPRLEAIASGLRRLVADECGVDPFG